MRSMERVIFGCLMVFGLLPGAMACTTASWPGGTTGLDTTVFAASPPDFSRYSELCALRVIGTGSVKDTNPEHERIRLRFYLLSQLTGSGNAVLFRAYADETDTSSLFEVRRNDGNLVFDTTAAGGASQNVAAPSGWVAIELDWDSGGSMDVWVNTDAATALPTTTLNAGTGTVEAVRLGLVAGLGGFGGGVIFDAYESHATTPVGLLLVGDANGNGSITIADAVTILNELNGTLSAGQPDCNLNGAITIADAVCALNAL